MIDIESRFWDKMMENGLDRDTLRSYIAKDIGRKTYTAQEQEAIVSKIREYMKANNCSIDKAIADCKIDVKRATAYHWLKYPKTPKPQR